MTARACDAAPRARGPSRLAGAFALPLAPVWPGHPLTGPGRARHSSSSGGHLVCPDAFELALLVQNCPADAGELVGERDRQHVVVQSLPGGFDPACVHAIWTASAASTSF